MNKYDEAIQEVKEQCEYIRSIAESNPLSKSAKVISSFDLALEALQQAKERENPQPLTLEQLRERVGKPVWLVFKGEDYRAICGVVHNLRPEIHMCDEILMFEDLHYVDVYDHEPKVGERL